MNARSTASERLHGGIAVHRPLAGGHLIDAGEDWCNVELEQQAQYRRREARCTECEAIGRERRR